MFLYQRNNFVLLCLGNKTYKVKVDNFGTWEVLGARLERERLERNGKRDESL